MTKRLRLLIILAFVGVSLWFLYPTVRWYFLISEDQRREANASRDQIRVLAQQRQAHAGQRPQLSVVEAAMPATEPAPEAAGEYMAPWIDTEDCTECDEPVIEGVHQPWTLEKIALTKLPVTCLPSPKAGRY